MKTIGKYSFGIGDRFGHQGNAQLEAIMKAKKQGIDITPVWNKSYREHTTVNSRPEDVRAEANEAVKAKGWKEPFLVDADHIKRENVDGFIDASDFFTIDVADYIGKPVDETSVEKFVKANKKYMGKLTIPGIDEPFLVSDEMVRDIGNTFLNAVQEAGKIYRHIAAKKGEGNFITEVSMDEVEEPQSPVELFFILSGLAQENIPAQTIAPKFTGRFNKGVDYEGDINQFAKEFEEDLRVLDFAVKEFGLPQNLKLSVHSGSDKFSIYPIMGDLIRKHDKGIHVKTAGTTWLEEMIGLALAGIDGLNLAKEIYLKGLEKKDQLCAPYATVIDIDEKKLPTPDEMDWWTCANFADALRHIPNHPEYNPHFRQLIHVSYKVAAEMGDRYTDALKKYAQTIEHEVIENIFDRHIKRIFQF
jgi:hypothetical protein